MDKEELGLDPQIAASYDRLEMLEAMVEGVREGLCILDSRAVMLYGNRPIGELLDFDPKTATGRSAHEFGTQLDFDWTFSGEAVASGVAVSTIQTLRNGRKVLVSAVPVRSSERSCVVVTIREVT